VERCNVQDNFFLFFLKEDEKRLQLQHVCLYVAYVCMHICMYACMCVCILKTNWTV
jgi:hypothetical protein